MRLLFGLALAWAAMLVFLPRNYCGRGSGKLTRCTSNLRVIGTALEMYSTDWSGRYPRELAKLTPNYLKTMPTCPATEPTRILPAIDVGCCGIYLFEPPHLREIPVGPGYDTYIATYQATAAPDRYTIFCAGHHHPQIPENFPRYTASEGLDQGWQ